MRNPHCQRCDCRRCCIQRRLRQTITCVIVITTRITTRITTCIGVCIGVCISTGCRGRCVSARILHLTRTIRNRRIVHDITGRQGRVIDKRRVVTSIDADNLVVTVDVIFDNTWDRDIRRRSPSYLYSRRAKVCGGRCGTNSVCTRFHLTDAGGFRRCRLTCEQECRQKNRCANCKCGNQDWRHLVFGWLVASAGRRG